MQCYCFGLIACIPSMYANCRSISHSRFHILLPSFRVLLILKIITAQYWHVSKYHILRDARPISVWILENMQSTEIGKFGRRSLAMGTVGGNPKVDF
ncbi:hypothetical protein GYMLUDRAFT_477499 [Collybiopsis luxurians FD-317 M1]|uniref:Uncharacterized protein n=1 Tax=Collybiopsis luxurians FD-317 M1 TaxID=944289 RepID=A0A0D0D1M0_9AGAR|nr:hypothetical protein GYMLUDRAFT_477499 [Collybiopsis luxurians FD-317 M1]